MVYCCVPYCKSDTSQTRSVDSNGEKISFHAFPYNSALQLLWIKAVTPYGEHGKYWRPSETSAICSRHFENSCFERYKDVRILKRGSVPTKFKDFPRSRQPRELQATKSPEKKHACDSGDPAEELSTPELLIIKSDDSDDSWETSQESQISVPQTSDLINAEKGSNFHIENGNEFSSVINQFSQKRVTETNDSYPQHEPAISDDENRFVYKKFKTSVTQASLTSSERIHKLLQSNKTLQDKVVKYKARAQELSRKLKEQRRIYKMMSTEGLEEDSM